MNYTAIDNFVKQSVYLEIDRGLDVQEIPLLLQNFSQHFQAPLPYFKICVYLVNTMTITGTTYYTITILTFSPSLSEYICIL